LLHSDGYPFRGDDVAGHCTFIGSSAGTNLACPTIRTTNDLPIVDVLSLDALGLVPFQINPHFADVLPAGLMDETRSERIAQFHEVSGARDVYLAGDRGEATPSVSGDTRDTMV